MWANTWIETAAAEIAQVEDAKNGNENWNH